MRCILLLFIIRWSNAMTLLAVRKSYKQHRKRISNMSPSMSVVLTLLCVLYCSEFCLAFRYRNCGSRLGKLTNVSVSECNILDRRCVIKRGTNVTTNITFIPNTNISQVNAEVYGIGVWHHHGFLIPYPLSISNACTDPHDGLHCPLYKGQEYTYTTTLFVPKENPLGKLNIKWELVNGNNNKIVCVEYPAKIVI